jgi:hypothetical protein
MPAKLMKLAALMDKGIIIGAEFEALSRSTLPFVLFRHSTSVRFIQLPNQRNNNIQPPLVPLVLTTHLTSSAPSLGRF